jgi:hypothetical protein
MCVDAGRAALGQNSSPEAPSDNVAGRQQNRREEIVIEEAAPIVRARGG